MKIEHTKKILWAVNVIAAGILVFVTVSVFQAAEVPVLSPDDTDTSVAAAQSQTLSEGQIASIVDSGTIVKSTSQQSLADPGEKPPVEVSANFEYKLKGTAIHPGMAFAFLEGPGGAQKVAAAGEKLGDATIVEIRDDEAVFERGGKTFIVKREVRDAASEGAGRQFGSAPPKGTQFASLDDALSQPQPTAEVPAAEEQPEEDAEGEEGEAEGEEDPDAMTMSEKQYKGYLDNIGKYVNELTILNHYGSDNAVDGLLLAKVPKESEAYKRGLRPGDLVTSVQGVAITDTATAARAAWDVYKNEDYYIEIGITRNGEEETLSYEIWPDEE